MADKPMNVGKELLQVPFPEMVKAMAKGIAEAQFELDLMSVRIARMMSGADEKDLVLFDGEKYSLLELGFMPSFYQFVDIIIEVKMSVSISLEESKAETQFDLDSKAGVEAKMGFFSVGGSASLNVSSVSASFASKYQYSAEGSSLMRTKLVPVPPPAILEKRIRDIVDRAEFEVWKLTGEGNSIQNGGKALDDEEKKLILAKLKLDNIAKVKAKHVEMLNALPPHRKPKPTATS